MTVGLLLIIIVMLYNVQSDNAPNPGPLPIYLSQRIEITSLTAII